MVGVGVGRTDGRTRQWHGLVRRRRGSRRREIEKYGRLTVAQERRLLVGRLVTSR